MTTHECFQPKNDVKMALAVPVHCQQDQYQWHTFFFSLSITLLAVAHTHKLIQQICRSMYKPQTPLELSKFTYLSSSKFHLGSSSSSSQTYITFHQTTVAQSTHSRHIQSQTYITLNQEKINYTFPISSRPTSASADNMPLLRPLSYFLQRMC